MHTGLNLSAVVVLDGARYMVRTTASGRVRVERLDQSRLLAGLGAESIEEDSLRRRVFAELASEVASAHALA